MRKTEGSEQADVEASVVLTWASDEWQRDIDVRRHESQSSDSRIEHLLLDHKQCQQENVVLEQEVATYKRELASCREEQRQLAQSLGESSAAGQDADRIRMELSACQHENATLRRRLDDKEGLVGANARELER